MISDQGIKLWKVTVDGAGEAGDPKVYYGDERDGTRIISMDSDSGVVVVSDEFGIAANWKFGDVKLERAEPVRVVRDPNEKKYIF
jgi:hypothetical protein